MTIRVCISGAASKRQTPQSPEYHFSSDPCFRVPPTGIPKPEPDEVPQAHRWRDRLAGFACAIVLAFGAGNMANASSPGGLNWNPERPVSANMAGKPSGSGAELLPRMDDWLPAANISTGQQSASQLDGARQDGNRQAEERKVASSTILQKEPVTGDGQATTTPDRVVLPDNLRLAILLDPRVEEMSARACQLAHRLGLAHAEGRPKVTASISGSRQIASRIKEIPPSRTEIRDGQLRIITPRGAEEIRRSGAHTREFDHREKNNIYDGKISVRHTVFDWGQISNRAEARTLNWRAAQIDARGVMRERSHDLLQLALILRRSDEVIAALQANFEIVKGEVDAVRARVEAGAGRLSDLREGQLVQLDQEIAINRAMAERDIVIEHLETEFDLKVEDALRLTKVFLSRRHPDLALLPADRTDKAHAIRLRARG